MKCDAALFGALIALGVPALLTAQSATFKYRVKVPRFVVYENLSHPAKKDTVWLQWNFGAPKAAGLTAGTVVQRQKTISIGDTTEAVVYSYTLSREDLRLPEEPLRIAPPQFSSVDATIYVAKEPSRLNVRPFLRPGTHRLTINGSDTTLSGDQLRALEYYYELSDRRSIRFRYDAFSAGALTIPLRFRGSYEGATGERVDPSVSTKIGVGLYGGYSWGVARYQYVAHANNAIQDVVRITVAGFGNLSTADADSSSSQTSADPLKKKITFATVAPGLALLLSVRGIDAGVFLGWDYGIANPDARRWDYQGSRWIGVGIGYQIFSAQ